MWVVRPVSDYDVLIENLTALNGKPAALGCSIIEFKFRSSARHVFGLCFKSRIASRLRQKCRIAILRARRIQLVPQGLATRYSSQRVPGSVLVVQINRLNDIKLPKPLKLGSRIMLCKGRHQGKKGFLRPSLLIGAGTKLDPTMFSAHGLRSGCLARASDL